MKNLKKAVGLAIVLAFPLLAVTVVMAQGGENRQDGEHRSTHAKNIKIHPRVLLKGADAEKFKKIKKHDEELATKGRFDNPPGQSKKDKTPSPECGSAATIYPSSVTSFGEENDFCAEGILNESSPALAFPEKGETVTWTCSNSDGEEVSCSASREEKERVIAATGKINTNCENDGEKYAIVIGVCDYPDWQGFNDICISDGDAKYMARALHTEYNFPLENIYLFRDLADGHISAGGDDLLSKSASKENIVSAIEVLRGIGEVPGRVQEGDEVVFFFSGHGATRIVESVSDGEGSAENPDEAILVHNGIENKNKNDNSGQLEYIWDDDLKTLFSSFNTDRITFIFDTCNAEGMNDVMEGATTDENGVGRVFVAATMEKNTAYVYSNGIDGEGVFSHYFVKNGMRGYDGPGGGWADGYNIIGWDYRTDDGWLNPPAIGQDGYVVVEEAYEYAREKIASYFGTSGLEQKPVLIDLFTDDLLLGYYTLIP